MRRTRRRSSVAALAAVVVAAVSSAPAAAADRGGAGQARHACPNGYVGLTFDDGPSETLPQLLATLRENRLRATMFNQGNKALERPEYVRDQLRAGMWVGNHTFSHPNLPQIGEPLAFQEIASAQWVLTDITGRVPTLFRPPYGATNAQVRADAERVGLLEVLWTVDSRDWAGATSAEIVAAAATLERGGIMLMHDWAQASIDAVPGIADVLEEKGLCAGRIVYSPRQISGVGTTFHAVAVRPGRRW